ncbi:hypothetical protein Kriimani_00011 [Pseudomonas phage vB_PpuP-Kriimani]
MSTLRIELISDVRNNEVTIALKDQGLGRVNIDKLPDIFSTAYRDPRALLADIKYRMSSVYFYCAPRASHKSITMTWEQALQTSAFLKEII